GQPAGAGHGQFGQHLAVVAVVDGDLVDGVGGVLYPVVLALVDGPAPLGDVDERPAGLLVPPGGHGRDPAVGEVDAVAVGPVGGPAGAERLAVGAVDELAAAVGAVGPDGLAVGAGGGPA